MKNILFIFLLLLSNAYSQLTEQGFRLELNGMAGFYGENLYAGGGLGARWLVTDRIGLRYNFDMLQLRNQTRHTHTPMGLVGGPILIANGIMRGTDGDTTTTGGLSIVSGLILMLLPEGFSYHIPITEKAELSPYANLLGIDFIRDMGSEDLRVKYACSFGVQFTALTTSNLTVQGFLETRKAAGVPWGIGLGVGVGWNFLKK